MMMMCMSAEDDGKDTWARRDTSALIMTDNNYELRNSPDRCLYLLYRRVPSTSQSIVWRTGSVVFSTDVAIIPSDYKSVVINPRRNYDYLLAKMVLSINNGVAIEWIHLYSLFLFLLINERSPMSTLLFNIDDLSNNS